MKKIISLALVLIVVLITGGCSLYGNNQASAPGAAPATAQPAAENNQALAVDIKNFSFNPATLTVKKNATVTWTNNDSVPHQIKSAAFNSDRLSQGQNFSFTFNDAGTFDYFCAIHPSMTGKIIVQ